MPNDAREPSVESLGSELVSATEALEQEERGYLDRRGGDSRRIYYAGIVTTARLTVCEFDPRSIPLADGMIPLSGARFTTADVVRFTKQLSTRPLQAGPPEAAYGTEAQALADAKARTVFLINATALDSFLSEFSVDDRAR